MKYLGVDFGFKKIGLALGDDGARVAVPFSVIFGGLKELLEVIKEEQIEALVIGLAVPEAHQSQTQLERTLAFAEKLRAESGLQVHVVDEQFTSTEARRVQKETGTKADEDALAAMLILQAYFDEGSMGVEQFSVKP
ncbi:MAG: Holliday junction resolvase RuvX [Patescibacteria group bacterium]